MTVRQIFVGTRRAQGKSYRQIGKELNVTMGRVKFIERRFRETLSQALRNLTAA